MWADGFNAPGHRDRESKARRETPVEVATRPGRLTIGNPNSKESVSHNIHRAVGLRAQRARGSAFISPPPSIPSIPSI
ncbi:hypothetical protein EYF80_042215 [Liparis tanakae]|uniref:Uncharacterized protein n=1 Tax=Liparis tanakae TaxID=230148 RepID=A0A4Z2G3X8_9TELE|nr:hypothetical protein EYF80_042215 [Liparis tanakae]